MKVKDKIFCYVHIEKAGGSTIHNWFKYYIPSYVSLHPFYIWSNEKNAHLTIKELKILSLFHPFMKGFGGHTTRHNHKYSNTLNSEIDYITFLRDPIKRYLSHFQHQKYVMGNNWSLESFINEKRFNDFMTIRIAGKADSEKAIHELKEHYSFIGLVENFNESLLLLSGILNNKNLKPFYEKVNEGDSGHKIEFSTLSKDIQSKIIENNKNDIILYNEVKNKIYPLQIENYKNDLNFDLILLEEELKSFKYNKLRKQLIKYLKGYNHFISEPISHFFR